MELTKLNLMDAPDEYQLTDDEQQLIMGGYYAGETICYWEHGENWGCTRDANEAYQLASDELDFWCCNCKDVNEHCGIMLPKE